ncbi:MAG TPA: recombinase family protein [Terriglobales bacterium]|nr:recombinase family protein [Terriglobales bacterium]
MKKAIELIRVSTEGQAADDRASIPAQHAVNERTCAHYGLEIVKSIEISDVSGASVLLAPEMQQLIQFIQSPDIDGVVTREFSRLMRPENFSDYALLQAFVDSNTVLYLPEGPLDLTSKTGRLMGTIRAAIAGLERTEILERIWTAKEAKRRRGELAQSQIVLPYGVGYAEGTGFYYKPEAERIREAFRQFLAGNQSYSQLAKLVGVTPRGAHLVLRNPIWTGWRVIDKKRDTSTAGRYASVNGRQADRRKIYRSAEEVIRVKVIAEPLVSEEEFQAVQRIMDLKQAKHWRSRNDYEHRFTYNGFLTCSACGEPVHTALARRDYYTCRGRRSRHNCRTKYMARERLEPTLDLLFASELTNPKFVRRCVEELKRRNEENVSASRVQRLTLDIRTLREKRARVIDGFVEGLINREGRDLRLSAIDHDIGVAQDLLARESPPASLDVRKLIKAFAPLVEWRYWTREQKRQILSAMVPEIRVADYRVESLGISLLSNEDTRGPAVISTTAPANVTAPRR